ncbi:hypothetical protein AAE478_000974 [Parahypoxylon ruwenzoriense]
MMTAQPHRRRSPEAARRRRKNRRHSREHLQSQQQVSLTVARYEGPSEPEPVTAARSRASSSSLSSSSSTSSSLVNISQPSRRFGLGAFFSGNGQKHQRRVKKKRSGRFLRFGNSSSSSVNSDLAYGRGYIDRRRRSREFGSTHGGDFGDSASPRRAQTDEEILELGRKFAEIARRQNAEDLRAAGRSRPSALVSAATALSQFRRTNSGNSNRGIASSKYRRDSSPDDTEWETDDDGSSEEFDSGLAYGSGLSLPSTSGKPAHPRSPPTRTTRTLDIDAPLRRKRSLVDPKLFGPVNSLRGYVDAPCGFKTVDRSLMGDSRRPYEPSIPRSETVLSEGRQLQRVYPVPTSDPGHFDAAHSSSVVSAQQDSPAPLRRPAPVPLQEPKPIAPVPRKILDSVETESRSSERSSSGKAPEGAVIASATSATISSVLSSDRRDDQDKYEGPRDGDRKRRSKRSDASTRDLRDEKGKSRDLRDARGDRHEGSRETRPEQARDSERGSNREKNRERGVPLKDHEYEQEKRHDEHRNDGYDYDPDRERGTRKSDRKDDQKIDSGENTREDRHEEDRTKRLASEDYKRPESQGPPQEGPIDPFQFQVPDHAFQTPVYETPKRPITPNVITIDREPDFSRFESEDVQPSERLSRRDSYERELRDARDVYEATEHATAPISRAALASATAAVIAEGRRGRTRSRGTDSGSRNRSRRSESPKRVRDIVQEDADRYYREVELARHIKADEERSHSDSESSIVDKWKQGRGPAIVDIAPPPEMNHPKKKSLYDGPNADVRVDNVLEHPSELSRFRISDIDSLSETLVFRARDPSAERERPLLNIVRPTPVPTPTLEKQQPAKEFSEHDNTVDVDTSRSAPDVAIESHAEIVPAPSAPKAVTWGENQTKHYVVESPEREDDPYSGIKIVTPDETLISRSGEKSGWESGESDEVAVSGVSDPVIDAEVIRAEHLPTGQKKLSNRRPSAQFESTYNSPPIPGPKPPSPRNTQMPGAFAEDPAFTASIAAALEGSGFNPNIVIDDASFHRRDSPPGSNDLEEYRTPAVESVIDFGVTEPSSSVKTQDSQGHSFVIGEVPETLVNEKEVSTNNSKILQMLSQNEQRRQDKDAERGDLERSEVVTSESNPVEAMDVSQSISEDDGDTHSGKLSDKEGKRQEKAAKAQALEDNIVVGDAPREGQEAETGSAETTAADEGDDAPFKRKESKKLKKATVLQDNSRQSDVTDDSQVITPVDTFQDVQDPKSSRATVPVDSFQDVQDAKAARSEDKPDVSKESEWRSKHGSNVHDLSPILASTPEDPGDDSKKHTKVEVISTPDSEWILPEKERQESRRDSGARESPSWSVPTSELSRESSYKVIDAESALVTEPGWSTPKMSEKERKHDGGAYDSLLSYASASEAPPGIVKKATDPDTTPRPEDEWNISGRDNKSKADSEVFEAPKRRHTAHGVLSIDIESANDWMKPKQFKPDSGTDDDFPSRVDSSADDIVESPKDIVESFHDLRGGKTAATEPQSDTLEKSKKYEPGSVVYDSPPLNPASRSVTPTESSMTNPKKPKQDSSTDWPPKSVPASTIDTSDSSKKSKKKKQKSTPGGFSGDNIIPDENVPPDKGKDRSETLDRSIGSIVFGPSRFDNRPLGGIRGRSATFDDAKSMVSAPSGADRKDRKGTGGFSLFGRFKSSIGKTEDKERPRKTGEEKPSFLDNADTLGAGVGSAGADVAHISQESRSKAINTPSEKEAQTIPITPQKQSTLLQEVEFIDPEIVPREIRPAIDPRYGDLLPLPPSRPGSPVPELGGDFPPLPPSRPETPEYERHSREIPVHVRRRSAQDSPLRPKTPSQSAIPIQFRLGHRPTTGSPSSVRYSPVASPIDGNSEFGSGSRNRSRPTSWENSREFKPLLLLLQRSSREPTDPLSSPDRESPSSERYRNISPRSEARESDLGSPSRVPIAPFDRDPELPKSISVAPLQLVAKEPSEAAEATRAVNTTPQPSEDSTHLQSDHTLQEKSIEMDDASHPAPSLESRGLPLADDHLADPVEQRIDRSKQPIQKSAENIEPSSPKLEPVEPPLMVPSLGLNSSFLVADIPRELPTLTPTQEAKDLDLNDTAKDSHEDSPKGTSAPIEIIDAEKTEGGDSFSSVVKDEISSVANTLNTIESITTGNRPEKSLSTALEYSQSDDEVRERSSETNKSQEDSMTADATPVLVGISSDGTIQQVPAIRQIPTVEEGTVVVEEGASIEQEPVVEQESPAIVPSSTSDELGSTIIKEVSTTAGLRVAGTGPPIATSETPVDELESTSIDPETLAVTELESKETPATEYETPPAEKGAPAVETVPTVVPESLTAKPESTTIEDEPAVAEKETSAIETESIAGVKSQAIEPEPIAVPRELASVKDEPIDAESEEPQQPVSATEGSTSVSEREKKREKKKDKQQIELVPSSGEPAKPAEELMQESKVEYVDVPSVGLETSSQDQSETVDFQESPDAQLSFSEEILPVVKKSKKKKKGKEIQSEEPESKVEIGSEQISTQEQESVSLSKEQLYPVVQEAGMAAQVGNQRLVSAPVDPTEETADYKDVEPQPNNSPLGDKAIGEVPLEEHAGVTIESGRDGQEMSPGIISPHTLIEPTSSELKTDGSNYSQSAISPSIGQEGQPHPESEPILDAILEETLSPNDTVKCEGPTVVPIVHEGQNIDQEDLGGVPTVAETSAQHPGKQEQGGLKVLEQRNVDESVSQPNALGGEDRLGRDLASVGPPSTPPPSSISTDDLRDKSAEQPGAVQEPVASTDVITADEVQPALALPSKPVAEESQGSTKPQEEQPTGKKKGKKNKNRNKNKKKRLGTPEVTEPEISLATPAAGQITQEPVPESVPQTTDSQIKPNVPSAVSDIPEELTQKSIEPAGNEPMSAAEMSQKGRSRRGSRIAGIDVEAEAPKSEKPLTESQPSTEEEAEPESSDVWPEVDSSTKESKEEGEKSHETADASVSVLANEDELSFEPNEEPATVVGTGDDSGQPITDSSGSIPFGPDPPAVKRLTEEPAEVESMASKEQVRKDEERDSSRIESLISETSQEAVGDSVSKGDTSSQELPSTEPTIDVDTIGSDTQVNQAQEETDDTLSPTKESNKHQNQSSADTNETPESRVAAPEIPTQPSAIPEELAQAERENSDSGSASTSNKDKERHQSIQFAEAVGQSPMEAPTEPAGEFSAPDTTFNPNWESLDIPPPPDDVSPKSGDRPDNVPISLDSLEQQRMDPLDRLIQHTEAKKQSDDHINEQTRSTAQDVATVAPPKELVVQKDTEVSQSTLVDKPEGELQVEIPPKGELDTTKQSSDEAVPVEEQSTNEQRPVETAVVSDPTSHDETPAAPVPTNQDALPTEVNIEDSQSSRQQGPVAHLTSGDSQAESISLTQDATPMITEGEPPTPTKKGKKGKKKRKSKGQDTLNSTTKTATPTEEPSIEAPLSEHVESPSVVSQDQAEPNQTLLDVPIATTEPEQLPPQPQEESPQSPVAKKGKKDKKKKKKASQTQGAGPSTLPIEEPTVDQPQPPVRDDAQLPAEDSSDLPPVQKIESQQPVIEEELSYLPRPPIPETGQVPADTPGASIPVVQEPELQPLDVAEAAIQRQDTGREKSEQTIQADKKEDNVPSGEPVPENAPSGESIVMTDLRDRGEARQDTCVTGSTIPEQESATEPAVLDEGRPGAGAIAASNSEKDEENKQYDSQITSDGIASTPSQDVSESSVAREVPTDEASLEVPVETVGGTERVETVIPAPQGDLEDINDVGPTERNENDQKVAPRPEDVQLQDEQAPAEDIIVVAPTAEDSTMADTTQGEVVSQVLEEQEANTPDTVSHEEGIVSLTQERLHLDEKPSHSEEQQDEAVQPEEPVVLGELLKPDALPKLEPLRSEESIQVQGPSRPEVPAELIEQPVAALDGPEFASPEKSGKEKKEKSVEESELEPVLESSQPAEELKAQTDSLERSSEQSPPEESTQLLEAVPDDRLNIEDSIATPKDTDSTEDAPAEVEEELEPDTVTPSESHEQAQLSQTPLTAEVIEQPDQPKVEEPMAAEAETSKTVYPETPGNNSEKRDAEDSTSLTTESEPEHDVKAENEPVATEPVPSHVEELGEPALDTNSPVSEPKSPRLDLEGTVADLEPVGTTLGVENTLSTNTIPVGVQQESIQPPTTEPGPAGCLDQDHATDLSRNTERETAEPSGRKQSPIPRSERDPHVSSHEENVAKDTTPDSITGTVTGALQVSADHLPKLPAKDSKEEETQLPGTPKLGTKEDSNTGSQSQYLLNSEDQGETMVSTEPVMTEEQLQAEKSSTGPQEQLPTNQQVSLGALPLKEAEAEPLLATRTELSKDEEKTGTGAQSESELPSGTQASPTQLTPRDDPNEAIVVEPTIQEPESVIANDDEFPETPTKKPKENKERRKAPATHAPRDTSEAILANAPLELVSEETTTGNPALENFLKAEEQSSEVDDIDEDDNSVKVKDGGEEAEREIDVYNPPETSMNVSEENQLASPTEQEHSNKGLTSRISRYFSGRIGLLPPISLPLPRAHSLGVRPTFNVDRPPAQLSSHVEHDRSFDQSPQPGKKLETEIRTPTEETTSSGLLPVITSPQEPPASYSETYPATTIQTDNKLSGTTQELSGPATIAPSIDISASSLGSHSSRTDNEPIGERVLLTQHEKPTQQSGMPSKKDMAQLAREAAEAVAGSRLRASRKKMEAPKDTDLEAAEATSDEDPTPLGVAALAEKFDGSRRAGSGDEKKQTYVDKKISSTEAGEQSGTPYSDPAERVSSDRQSPRSLIQDSAAEDGDAESPVVGRGVQHDVPKPHRTSQHSPKRTSQHSPKPSEAPASEIIDTLDELDTSEHVDVPEPIEEHTADEGSLKSPSPVPSAQDYSSSGRASPRVLPPVEEETREELEMERKNQGHETPTKSPIITDTNRDSGFITSSPDPVRRSPVDSIGQRDSGVHLHDLTESTPKKQDELLEKERSATRTPQSNDRRSKRLFGLGSETPTLGTPANSGREEESQSATDPRKPRSLKNEESGQRSISENMSRRSTPLMERQLRRSASNTSISRLRTPEPLSPLNLRFRPDSPGIQGIPSTRSGTNTPPLRRADRRMSGDLRSLNSNLPNNNNASRENLPHQSTTPVANEGRVRAKDMTDVYDGYGEGRIGSPRSPTRPQSMRRRHSMQVLELEAKVEQLLAENHALADAKARAEQNLSQQAASAITERDAEIESLKASLEWLRKEVTRLTEVNAGLNSANNVLALQHNEKYGRLESQHASAARELEEFRDAKDQYSKTLQEKDTEIQELRAQLEATKEQVRELQRQILAAKPPDAEFLRLKDEDHFDHRCQQLCSHVQQWVLRFSKFSDMRACRLTREINDEKIIDRLDNSVLDGSDVDEYLSDRVKRRDIFMSMTMNMIWDFVFTRYLFGMDREQRQKLKSLEKLLLEVGPLQAVRQWRAVTLTLLSKRPAFGDQRNQDTEAVVQAILRTLTMILPPPSNLEAQIQSQLRRVMREAVDLSIEMRTQRAEYMMLPPLQPEYDGNGELARTVPFNASLMNERSGDSTTNEEYQGQGAIIRTVLFPLVVKKGDDNGVGDEEIVIFPAQVLVAKPRYSTIRMVTPSSEEMGGVPLSRGTTPSIQGTQSNVSFDMRDIPLPAPTGPLTPPRDSPRHSPRHSPRYSPRDAR